MQDMEEPEKRSCAVCAKVLNSFRDERTGEVSWVHQDLLGEHDHPAVPVAQDEVATEYLCDFCNAQEPEWTVPARPFGTGTLSVGPGELETASGENWAACGPCGRLVDTNQWNALLSRVKQSWRERQGREMPPEAENSLKSVYRTLRKNITGSLRPFEKP